MFLPPVLLFQSEPQGDFFAESFFAGCDMNLDGVPDLVIADGTRQASGVWIVSGRDGSVLIRREGIGESSFPDVHRVGDIDRDGSPEVAVSFRSHDKPCRAEILSGKSGTTLLKIRGEDFGFDGCRVTAAGSFDEDGSPDLLVVGMRSIDKSERASAVLVYSSTKKRELWRVEGEPRAEGQGVGQAVGVGDVDGDDRDDVAVAWMGGARNSRVIVYSGATGLLMSELLGQPFEAELGCSLDGGFDFNGDRRPDILVGSPEFGAPSRFQGRVHVYSAHGGSLLRMLDGADFGREQDQFGECVRFVRDTTGDGVPEILVGAPEELGASGAAYLCSGKTGSILFAILGSPDPKASGIPVGEYHVGRALSAAGDVDRDGVEDFAVANVPYCSGQFGLVRVFSGKTGKVLLRIDRDSLLRAKPLAPTPR